MDVIHTLYHDKDVLAASCPMKTLPMKYVVSVESHDLIDGKFVEAHNAGTGFMMIKKEVFSRMFEAYPELKYSLDPNHVRAYTGDKTAEKMAHYTYTLFDTGTEQFEDGTIVYLSEDFLFCRRWQDIGGKVLMNPEICLNHIGTYKFRGAQFWGFGSLESARKELPPHGHCMRMLKEGLDKKAKNTDN